ncbi:antigen 5 like allergen Cul n 1-like [Anopheles darlingi]|uniref:antigen 5 like allergen Cul n 1-like n=1 Tax=Anopheles darlingi TaxID=43151 RepID=UPI00210035C4|nr:antigen 5 like allergen Cul n 1-like [Anopheles darlingi]
MATWITGTVAFLLFALLEGTLGYDYCSTSDCHRQGEHVGCRPPATSGGPTCKGLKDARKVRISPELQQFILNEHNKNRSRLALGQVSPYRKAQKMPTLVWDPELASLADANARSCNYGHDHCRSTQQFPYAGQNIAITKFYGYKFTDKELVTRFVSGWWSEYVDARPQYITAYPTSYSGKPIGHFTQIASDRTTKVGCSMWYWKDGQFDVYYFVCNYSVTNIIKKSVYLAGDRTGSQCKKGLNSKFPGLCNVGEAPRTLNDA